jgi:Family of unknown function (DUF6545)
VLVLATLGLVTAWIVVILRVTLATTRMERQLLAAIAATCVLITLFNPYVVDWLNRLIGLSGGVVVRHVTGIVTAVIMVSFAIAPSHPTHVKWWVISGIATLTAVIFAHFPAKFTVPIDWATVDYSTFGSWPVVYFILLGGYCVSALVATIIAFMAAAHAITNLFTRVSLWLICVSLLLNAIPWIMTVISLTTKEQIWIQYVPALDGLNALFLAVALLIAFGGAITARIQAARTVRRLYPFWLALTKSVPNVVLSWERGWFWRRYGIQRLSVELRDCFLILSTYIDLNDIDEVRRRAAGMPGLAGNHDAVMTALSLHRAQANKTAGMPPAAREISLLPASGAITLDDDVAELIQIGDAYSTIANNTMGLVK